MKCIVCGRELKDSQSIQRRYGPVCYGRSIGKYSLTARKVEENNNIPGQLTFDDFPELTPKGVDTIV